MIIVLGSIVARPDTFSEVLKLSQAHVARSRTEPGCLSHAVHQDTERAQRLVFVETWADRAALAAHFQVRRLRLRQDTGCAGERAAAHRRLRRDPTADVAASPGPNIRTL